MTEQMTVQCPGCDHRFETYAVGDMAGCPACENQFLRFANAVEEDQ